VRFNRLVSAVLLTAVLVSGSADAERIAVETHTPLPEFTHTGAQTWLNSAPLTVADLRGKVVLVHVWAFECWNCYRSFPWLADVEEKYGAGLIVVGVHTPEFEREKVALTIAAKAQEFGLLHPIMIDSDHSY